ncbi:TPA: hypothetical protein ACH3X2_004978 [Trebouxia sp. C0005]
MLPSDVLNDPLFNRQISQPAASSAAINSACPAAAASFPTPQQKPLMLSASIIKVAHRRLSLQLQQPQLLAVELHSVLLALPPAWRTVVSSAPAFTWFQVRSASGRQLIQDAQTGQLHTIGPHLQLQQVPLEPVLDPSPVQFQGLSVSISVSRSLQNKHEQRKAKAADTSGKQARRKAKKVKRQASKRQSGQQHASPPQLARSEAADAQPALEQQGLVPDDEPLLTAFFPLPGGITSLPIVEGPPAALARLHPAPSSAAKGLGSPPPVTFSPRASMPDAASPLAGKRRALSLCQM